ncbi:hypothetical protein LTR86_011268 [Recurvomyces mirabilis]|nr:hypothetical protein LTR86_011268 [Recurvomyces mirabilis]
MTIPVSVSLTDLRAQHIPTDTFREALGPGSLGIILVQDLDPYFSDLRRSLLSYASYLGSLPADELSRLERPDVNFEVGWSCGKESLGDKQLDSLKGSYYMQPIHDSNREERARRLYPNCFELTTPNVWPEEKTLPGFSKAYEDLVAYVYQVAILLVQNCDKYMSASSERHIAGSLEKLVRHSVTTKARLLHYYPPPDAGSAVDRKSGDSWCASHRDLAALTGLVPEMFVDEAVHPPYVTVDASVSLPPLSELDAHPDPSAGLWIQDQAKHWVHVHIPRNNLAFQIGTVFERVTGGSLQAATHHVRRPTSENAGKIARNTLALFLQPDLWEKIGDDMVFADLAKETIAGTNGWSTGS